MSNLRKFATLEVPPTFPNMLKGVFERFSTDTSRPKLPAALSTIFQSSTYNFVSQEISLPSLRDV